MQKSYDSLVVFSGGLDSTTLIHHVMGLDEVPLALSFNYGQNHIIELDKAKLTAKDLNVDHITIDVTSISDILSSSSSLISNSHINIPTIEDIIGHPQPNTYVPFRNLMMLTMAASVAESYDIPSVYTGVQAQDLYAYWDTSAEFIARVNNVLALNRKFEVYVLAPYVYLNKAKIIEQGIGYGVDYSKTNTCYNPNSEGIACGICPSCSERIQAFIKNGIEDPIPYQVELDWDRMLCVQ